MNFSILFRSTIILPDWCITFLTCFNTTFWAGIVFNIQDGCVHFIKEQSYFFLSFFSLQSKVIISCRIKVGSFHSVTTSCQMKSSLGSCEWLLAPLSPTTFLHLRFMPMQTITQAPERTRSYPSLVCSVCNQSHASPVNHAFVLIGYLFPKQNSSSALDQAAIIAQKHYR